MQSEKEQQDAAVAAAATAAAIEARYTPKDVSTINYGSLASNLSNHSLETFYLTTAIAYTNGYPHIGHAYEFLTSDVIVRYHRLLGYDTYFLTGADEHGQKVAASAEKNGIAPIDHCNKYVDAFKALNQRLAVSYSSYLRTTDSTHKLNAQLLWKLCHDSGDIYLDNYEGWYNEREELFVTEAEAEVLGYKDKDTGLPLKRVKEESYFFRMSKFTDRLIAFIEENDQFIQPDQYRNSILFRLRNEGLKDLSISRTSFAWGIPVPEGFDSKHVMYVWFDALSNYLSGVNFLSDRNGGVANSTEGLARYWPPNKHIIGKDIIWFHCVIWPCMLMSANLPLPGGVFSHGFVMDLEGKKMSKSMGNVVDPIDVLDKYHVDTVRYYFCASGVYGSDLNFNEAALIMLHNSELADILGNLVHRILTLCQSYCDGKVPDVHHDSTYPFPFDASVLITAVTKDIKEYNINLALFKGMEAVRCTNKYLTDAEPWKLKGPENLLKRQAIVRTSLEAIYMFMHVLAPVLPITAKEVFDRFHTEPVALQALSVDFYNLKPHTEISSGDILFTHIEVTESTKIVSKKKPVAKTEASVPIDPNQDDFTKMDFRVGQVVKVWEHETADRLYCCHIDVGETEPRPIVSGIRSCYTLEQLLDRKVVVICNLLDSKIQGFTSKGMVLAAKSIDGTTVELLTPHADAVIGERVVIEGLAGTAIAAKQVKKNKVWESVNVDLHTDNNMIGCWKDKQLLTSTGPCHVISLQNSVIG